MWDATVDPTLGPQSGLKSGLLWQSCEPLANLSRF